jgi:3-oxoacyl-[acyl-carrier-protein] synthase-1
MIQLAVPAITQALDGQVTPMPIFVGLPESHPGLIAPAFAPSEWIKALAFCLGSNLIDISQSVAFPLGRASAFAALDAAMKYLAAAPGRSVLVGAVDTFWDVPLLAQLMKEGRILAEDVSDGFIPGEGAAFVLFTSRPKGDQEPATLIKSTGVALDSGHRYSDQPAKGEGLSMALEKLRNTFAPMAVANFVLAGYNGERFDSKQWGVAAIRHKDLFAEDHMFEHPADCFGDLGAALGAMLLVLANAALVLGHRESPALVWAGSDLGTYGATWLELIS